MYESSLMNITFKKAFKAKRSHIFMIFSHNKKTGQASNVVEAYIRYPKFMENAVNLKTPFMQQKTRTKFFLNI